MKTPASVTRILVILVVFGFSSPAFSATPQPETEKPQQGITGTEDAAALVTSKGTQIANRLGGRIAGTYLVTRQPKDGPTRILNIFADGNLTSIQSIQFGGGALGGSAGSGFSNQHGTWKQIGKREIEASVLDLQYDFSTGAFLGTTIARYTLQFDSTLKTVTGHTEGKIFSPGVDPLNPGDNQPIVEFTDTFQAQRVTVGD